MTALAFNSDGFAVLLSGGAILPAGAIDLSDADEAAIRGALSRGATVEPDGDGWQIVEPVQPTEAEALAAWRLTARKDRGPLCLALHAAGILSAASALEASKGNWPAEFAGFLDGMTDSEQLAAQIAWADATVVRYQNTLLQDAALAYADGDAAAATAILDSLFGAP